jgi:hypothetical protein
VTPHQGTLGAKLGPPDRISIDDASFEAAFHVSSDDARLAQWWISSSSLRERLWATEGRWGYRINGGTLEARAVYINEPTVQQGLSAVAALALRGAELESELQAARTNLVGLGTFLRLDLVRERHGTLVTRIDTRTRFFAQRPPGQAAFSLERHLTGETKRLYDEVAPVLVDADAQDLRLDLDGVVTDPDVVVRAGRLAARLAQPEVTPLDEGPYR